MNYAYLAGLIDGDGYIGLVWHNCHKRFAPIIKIKASYNKELDDYLIAEQCERYQKNNAVDYRFSERKCYDILEKILPFLVIKKKKGELLLSSKELLPGGGNKYTEEHIKKILPIYTEMKELSIRKRQKQLWNAKKILKSFNK
jgi:hypothetical protein